MRTCLDTDQAVLLQGEALSVLSTLPSESVDAVITDPPYSSGGAFRGDRMAAPSVKYQNTDTVKSYGQEFSGDNRDQRSFLFWCSLWLSECLRVAKPGAVIGVFSDWRQLPTVCDAVQAGGWVWRGIAAWDKTEGVRPYLGRFRAQCEFLAWGTKGARPAMPEIGALPGVFRACSKSSAKFHLCGKPVPVMREIVRVAPRGGVVLDPFAGSASTGVAALLEGRSFIGIELLEGNCAVSERRLREAEAQAQA